MFAAIFCTHPRTPPALCTFYNFLHLTRRWQTHPGIRSRGCRQREREAAEAGAAPSLCVFPLQSRAARRLTHSLWDTLNNSPSGKCGWISNENRSSLCFINCCYYRHFQIPHIPLTNRQPCRYVGAGKRRKMLVCHCSSVAVHFLCNWCEAADMHVEAFGLCVFVAALKTENLPEYTSTAQHTQWYIYLFLSIFFFTVVGVTYITDHLKYTRHLWI